MPRSNPKLMVELGATRAVLQHQGALAVTLDAIERHLTSPNLLRFRIAVAYARWDGLGLLSSNIEKLLGRGGSFELIVGIENGVTTPDALLYGLVLEKRFPKRVTTRAIVDEYANSIMHTKLYEFHSAQETTALIGSANLTGGGLVRNTELSIETTVTQGSHLQRELDDTWNVLEALSQPASLEMAQRLLASKRSGNEKDESSEALAKEGKRYLAKTVKPAPKPLFKKILGIKNNLEKNRLLAQLDSLTDRPDVLYLQILEYETGGTPGRPGYQVQLPVATLGAYFGVGKRQSKPVRFQFAKEDIHVNLTHFENNTHRVRLRPITSIQRPAILKFLRVGEDDYKVEVVPKSRYQSLLDKRCDQQSREGARKWGFG